LVEDILLEVMFDEGAIGAFCFWRKAQMFLPQDCSRLVCCRFTEGKKNGHIGGRKLRIGRIQG